MIHMGIALKLPKISIPAPKLSNISVPKPLDISRAAKGTLASVQRSDLGQLGSASLKLVTLNTSSMTEREKKALTTSAAVGAAVGGGVLLAGSSTGAAIGLGATKAGGYIAANPLQSTIVGAQLARGNTQGAIQTAGSMPSYGAVADNISMPQIGDSIPQLSQGNLDTIASLVVNNQPGVRPTLANSSTQAPMIRPAPANDVQGNIRPQETPAQAQSMEPNYLMIGGVVIGAIVILKLTKVI